MNGVWNAPATLRGTTRLAPYSPPCSAEPFQVIQGAGDNDLARRIEVGDPNPTLEVPASLHRLLGPLLVHPQNGRHTSRLERSRLGHGPASGRDQAEALVIVEYAGRSEGRVFTKRMSGRGGRTRVNQIGQLRPQRIGDRIQSGLCLVCARQFGFRAVATDFLQGPSEDLIRGLAQQGRPPAEQISSHANELAPLSGKKHRVTHGLCDSNRGEPVTRSQAWVVGWQPEGGVSSHPSRCI